MTLNNMRGPKENVCMLPDAQGLEEQHNEGEEAADALTTVNNLSETVQHAQHLCHKSHQLLDLLFDIICIMIINS